MKSGPYLSKSGPYSLPRFVAPSPLGKMRNPANLNIPRSKRGQRRDFDLPRVPYKRAYNNYRNWYYLLSLGVKVPLRFNPWTAVAQELLSNPWIWFDQDPLLGGDYAYNGPGVFKICPFEGDWGSNTFYVDAGEVLGSSLTCLTGQAIFSQNFADNPNLHRNLWLMRQYTIVPGLDRSASLWVRHVPAGNPAPYPLPGPMPYAVPGSSVPWSWPDPYPWNPFVPETNPLGGLAPEPMPLPWRRATANRRRHPESMGEGQPAEVPVVRPRPRTVAPPGRHPPARPPRRREKEQKTNLSKGKWLRLAGGLLGGVSEVGDFVDSLYDAIPYRLRRFEKGRRMTDKIEAIYKHFWRINAAKAIGNFAQNQVEDWAVGKFGSAAKRGTQSASKRGYWTRPVGATAGPAI